MATTAPRRILALLTLVLLASVALRAQGPPAPRAPVQPLPFSHFQHVDLGVECAECHVNPDPGKLMTYPATATCMSCHRTLPAGGSAALQKLGAFAASDKPIPWVRVYQLPDFVYWDHRVHVQAKIACTECHGPVATRDALAPETNIVTMQGCVACHDKRQVFTDCADCHEPRQ
jgi:c(7)-type cytochrome triheme protein